MFRRILLPLDGSAFTETALAYSCLIAKQNNSEITGITVLDKPGIEKSIGPVGMGGSQFAEKLRVKREDEYDEQITSYLDHFSEYCTKEGVTHFRHDDQGSPVKKLIEQSIFYDLIVLGLKSHYSYDETDSFRTIDRIFDHVVTPILAVPETFVRKEKYNVVIAYDGSLPSSRAMHRFVEMFSPAIINITLLGSNDKTKEADYYLENAEKYLNAHSFKNIVKKTAHSDIKSAINDVYEWADIISVGMHSRPGIIDFFVGGFTQYLIHKGDKALFIG